MSTPVPGPGEATALRSAAAAAVSDADAAPPDGAPQRWSRSAEEKLRRMFLHEARERCAGTLADYAACAKAEGVAVVWRCRDRLAAANDCVKQHSTDARYAEYKQRKKGEWVRQGVLLPDP